MKYFSWPNLRWLMIIILLLANICVWYAISVEKPSGTLRVSFLNVGQGDSALIVSPTGNRVLIDGGPDRKVLRELSSELPFYADTMDLLMESHPDSDHIAGLPDVLSKYGAKALIEPCIPPTNNYETALRRIAESRDAKRVCAERGQEIDLGGGAKLKIIFTNNLPKKTNDDSIIAKLTYGQTSFLFTGDTTVAAEKYLEYVEPGELHANVLKVSHHGSKESNDLSFLQLVGPQFAVISVGQNHFGHPAPAVVQNLANISNAVLRTDQSGDINFVTDGKVVSRQ